MPLVTLLVDDSLEVLQESTEYSCHEDIWNAAIQLFLSKPRRNHQYLLLIDEVDRYHFYNKEFRLRGNEVLSPDGYHHLGRVAAKYIRGTIRYVERG